jgi:hypothetical protein
MGHSGGWQLHQLPKHVDGTLLVFISYPFQFNDFKECGHVKKQPDGINPKKALELGMRFFMDFGFMRASHSDYRSPRLGTDQVVECFESFSAYLIVVDEASHYVWVFLQTSKNPLVDLIFGLLALHGSTQGGVIHTNLGRNWPGVPPFDQKLSTIINMWLNPWVLIASPRMQMRNNGTKHFPSPLVCSFMDLVSPPATGLRPWSTPCISTNVGCTA